MENSQENGVGVFQLPGGVERTPNDKSQMAEASTSLQEYEAEIKASELYRAETLQFRGAYKKQYKEFLAAIEAEKDKEKRAALEKEMEAFMEQKRQLFETRHKAQKTKEDNLSILRKGIEEERRNAEVIQVRTVRSHPTPMGYAEGTLGGEYSPRDRKDIDTHYSLKEAFGGVQLRSAGSGISKELSDTCKRNAKEEAFQTMMPHEMIIPWSVAYRKMKMVPELSEEQQLRALTITSSGGSQGLSLVNAGVLNPIFGLRSTLLAGSRLQQVTQKGEVYVTDITMSDTALDRDISSNITSSAILTTTIGRKSDPRRITAPIQIDNYLAMQVYTEQQMAMLLKSGMEAIGSKSEDRALSSIKITGLGTTTLGDDPILDKFVTIRGKLHGKSLNQNGIYFILHGDGMANLEKKGSAQSSSVTVQRNVLNRLVISGATVLISNSDALNNFQATGKYGGIMGDFSKGLVQANIGPGFQVIDQYTGNNIDQGKRTIHLSVHFIAHSKVAYFHAGINGDNS